MLKVKLKSKTVAETLLKKNKSQNWLAMRCDISSGYMSQLMNNQRCPSPDVRKKILAHFKDREFDDLFEIQQN